MAIIDQVWEEMKKQNFTEIIVLIKSHPEVDIINSLNEGKQSLMLAALYSSNEKPIDFMKLFLKNPNFNLQYSTPRGIKTTETILDQACVEYLDLLRNDSGSLDPRILIENGKVLYSYVKRKLDLNTRAYDTKSKPNPTSTEALRLKSKVENFEKMLPAMRDATILLACELNDATILDQLKAAGANPETGLNDGTSLKSLLAKSPTPKPNISKWNEENEKKPTPAAQTTPAVANNDNAFFNLKQSHNEFKKATAEYLAATTKVLQTAGDKSNSNLVAAMAAMK